MNRHRQRGHALLFVLLVMTLLTLALSLVANLVAERQRAVDLEVREVRLQALLDAALAESVARLAADLGGWVDEAELGGGTYSSEVRQLSSERVEVLIRAEISGSRRRARAVVDLSDERPRVVRWERLPAGEGQERGP